MDTRVDVVVVGAGPVGLFLARELIRHGLSVRIVEASAHQSQHSKALAIMPRTLEIFESAGVVAPVLAAANKVADVSIFSGGRPLGAIPFSPKNTRYDYVAMVPQDVTEAILVQELAAVGGRVEYHTELIGLESTEQGVQVRLLGGADVLARFVVGCDGAHSTVRHLLGLPFEGGAYAQAFLLADIDTETDLRPGEMLLCPNAAGAMACFPMNAKRCRIVAMVDHYDVGEPDLAYVNRLVEARGMPQLRATRLIWANRFRIHHRETPQMRDGAIFLAGDAAHIHSPFGAQGMNNGLQDAWNLAWKLRFALAGWAKEPLLESYSAERHQVAHAVIRGTDALTRVMATRSPLLGALRNQALSILTRVPAFRALFVSRLSEFDVHYRGSTIVSGNGARAADEACLTPERLFQALGNGYVLLLPAALDRQAFAALAARYGHCLSIVNARAERARIRLIRPDGYIAYEATEATSATSAARAIERLLGEQLQAAPAAAMSELDGAVAA
jgi:2-polyprenyl-6-methoxyphenol hydroxylase-like FAD-dependent oxidoreductase